MEFKIRNVDPTTVKKIYEEAKKHDQPWQQLFKKLGLPISYF